MEAQPPPTMSGESMEAEKEGNHPGSHPGNNDGKSYTEHSEAFPELPPSQPVEAENKEPTIDENVPKEPTAAATESKFFLISSSDCHHLTCLVAN